MMKKKMDSPVGKILKTGVTNMVGIGLIGATSGMVNQLPAGTAKSVAGIVPGLQSAALVTHNLKMVPQMGKQNSSNKLKGSKLKW